MSSVQTVMKRALPWLIVLLAFMSTYITLLLCSPPVQEAMLNFVSFFEDIDPSFSLPAVFLFMLIGNSTSIPVGIPATYFFAKSIAPGPFFWLEMLIFSLCAGFGAGIGEMAVYGLGRGAAVVLKERKSAKNIHDFVHLLTRNDKLAPFFIFLFGLTPLPDPLIMVPLGISKYPMKKTILPCALGKTCFAFFLALGAKFFGQMAAVVTIPSLVQEAILMGLVMVVMIFCLSIEWSPVVEKYAKNQLKKISEKENSKLSVEVSPSKDENKAKVEPNSENPSKLD
ncbi:MAG: hypothetical protein ACFFCS_11390 [Candidatus Hodarchaeota archaeon]